MPGTSVYDSLDDLPTETPEVRLGLAGFDYVVIDIDVTSGTGAGITANETGHILIGTNRTVSGQTYGLDLTGHGSTVTNQGTIRSMSETGAAIRLAGVETYSIVNFGTVTAAGLAIEGSQGVDRIINAGVLESTATAANAVLLDLGIGNDFYDGTLGRAIGGGIKLGIGNDTAYGGAFSEIFVGGAGNDYLYGGGGIDTADYSEATNGISVDLNKTAEQNIGAGQDLDTLIDIENVIGGDGSDLIIGNAAHNTFKGGGGNDTLEGGLGNDVLEGGEGNDTLYGGSGDDVLRGGNGTNTARYFLSSPAKVDLNITIGQNTGQGTDTLIDIMNLEGGSGNDTFIGNGGNNELDGNAGNDTLTGGGGNDTLDGGAGRNTAVFTGARAEYTISAKNPDGTYTVKDNHDTPRDGVDTLMDVRFLKFSDQTVALTNGNPSDIYLSGTSMAENKPVGTALGSLLGTDPDGDKLTFSLSSNPGGYFGFNATGDGLVLLKKLDYETVPKHTIKITAKDDYGGIRTETFTIYVQNVIETTPLVRRGTSKGEPLTGESGNDKLYGLGGNDALYGQIGHDTLIGGTGSDNLFGGTGRDVFVFDQALSVKSNLDYISDFKPTDDVIHLSRAIFTKIAKGTLSSKAFVTGNQFKDKDDRILYLKDAGALFYDPDGSGSAKAIQFANLSKNLKLTAADFFIF